MANIAYGALMYRGVIDDPTIDVRSDLTIEANPGMYTVAVEGNESLPSTNNQSIGYLYSTPLSDGNLPLLRFHDFQSGLWWVYFAGVWITTTPESIGALATLDTAVAALKLSPGRSIGGVRFDGSVDINLPGVNAQGNQNTTGNAASATKLQTARTINGVSFNGTANITITAAQIGSYTKAESDSKYLTGFRLSAQTMITTQQAPASTLVSYVDGGDDAIGIGYKSLQFLRNGVYVTVTQA